MRSLADTRDVVPVAPTWYSRRPRQERCEIDVLKTSNQFMRRLACRRGPSRSGGRGDSWHNGSTAPCSPAVSKMDRQRNQRGDPFQGEPLVPNSAPAKPVPKRSAADQTLEDFVLIDFADRRFKRSAIQRRRSGSGKCMKSAPTYPINAAGLLGGFTGHPWRSGCFSGSKTGRAGSSVASK